MKKGNMVSPFSKTLGGLRFNQSGGSVSQNSIRTIKTDEQRAVESKLISQPYQMRSPQQKGPNGDPFPNSQLASTVINDTTRNIIDSRNLTRLLPDIKVARMLLVSAIQSPNDLVSCTLTYGNESDEFGNIKSPLIEIIKENFEGVHKIEEVVPVWLDDILFDRGAKVLAVIPESGIEAIINADINDRENRLRIEAFASSVSDNGALTPTGLLGSPPGKDDPKPTYGINEVIKRARNINMGHESANGVIPLDTPKLNQERKITLTDKAKPEVKMDVSYILQDNPDILKLKKLNERVAVEEARQRMKSHFGLDIYTLDENWDDMSEFDEPEEAQAATESFTEGSPNPIVTQSKGANSEILNFSDNKAHGLIRDREYNWTPVRSVPTTYRKNVGEPTIMEIPAECVIPAYLQGRPSDHIGYFFAIDQTGGFVTVTDDTDYYREMQGARDNSDNVSGQMIEQVNQATYGTNQSRRTANVREDQQLLSAAVLNHTFLEALEHGAYKGVKLALGNTEGVSRLMLQRALVGDHTHFLYVPKDLVTYIAFDYNDYGVGISLLAQNKMQGAIRAMMQFTNTQTAINNAMIHTTIDVTFDEYESDPERTIEQIYHEHVRRRVAAYPLGVSSPLDQLEYLAIAGTSINVENHPSYPGTQTEVSYHNSNIAPIDTEYTDQLKRDFLQGLGINPESIDMSMGVELAQSIVTSNLLLAKRAMIYQDKFCVGMTDHLKKYCLQSNVVREALVQHILDNKDEFKGRKYYKALAGGGELGKKVASKLALKFISHMDVSLPRPDLNTMEMQLAGLEAKDAFYEQVVDYVISEDIIADWEVGPTVTDALQHFRSMFKNYLMRQYIQEENIAPELFTLLGFDEGCTEITTLLESSKEYRNRIGRFLAGYVKESSKQAESIETIATDAGQNEMVEGGDSDGLGDDYGFDDGFDTDFDDMSFEDDSAFGEGDFTSEIPGE